MMSGPEFYGFYGINDGNRAEIAESMGTGNFSQSDLAAIGNFLGGNVSTVNGTLLYTNNGAYASASYPDAVVGAVYSVYIGGAPGGDIMQAGIAPYKDGFNIAAYLASTSTTVNEFYRGYEFSKAYRADPRRALNKAFPGRFNGLSTNTLNKLADYRLAKAIAKGFSKPLLGVGIALTAVDIYQNDFSASSIAWGAADTGIAIAAIAVSGPAAPFVAVGAVLYFTGRFAYGVYEAYNEGN